MTWRISSLTIPSIYRARQKAKGPVRGDFIATIAIARMEMKQALEAACGKPIAECAREDTGRFSNAAADEAFYASTQTYNLPAVYPKDGGTLEDVAKMAPGAGYLLTVAFRSLSLEEADKILTETEGLGDGFLDDGTAFGVYSRLNLYAAAACATEQIFSK